MRYDNWVRKQKASEASEADQGLSEREAEYEHDDVQLLHPVYVNLK